MKILFLSDLHLDNNSINTKMDLLPDLINHLNKKSPDIVIISGDLSGDARTSLNILELLRQNTQAKILFIPGNHDIWTNTKSSWEGYELLKNHSSSLINKPHKLNEEWIIIGSMGWYDYSFGLESLPPNMYPRLKKKLWKDALYAKWGISDIELNEKLLFELEQELEMHRNKKIILATHFVPYEAFIKKSATSNDWNIQNGFMGSTKFGELINKYDNIHFLSFGHTHKRYGHVEYKNKSIICSPLGYAHEWKSIDFTQELEESSIFINIQN